MSTVAATAVRDAIRHAGRSQGRDTVAECGLHPHPVYDVEAGRMRSGSSKLAGELHVAAVLGRLRLRGVIRCRAPLVCVAPGGCAGPILAARAAWVRSLVAAGEAAGLTVAMVTLTVSHHGGEALGDVLGRVRDGWARMAQGRWWTSRRARYGVAGWARALEVTYGEASGWHPHFHLLVWATNSYRFGRVMVARWLALQHGHAGRAGQDVRPADHEAGAYLQKLGAGVGTWDTAAEAVRSDVKRARAGRFTPLGLAQEVVATGEEWAMRRLAEWVRGSAGVRGWQTSLRLGEALGVGEAQDELEAVEAGPGAWPLEGWVTVWARWFTGDRWTETAGAVERLVAIGRDRLAEANATGDLEAVETVLLRAEAEAEALAGFGVVRLAEAVEHLDRPG